MVTLTQDRNYLRQMEDKDLLLLAQRGDNELALVLAERIKEQEDERDNRESDYHGQCCTCFD